MLLPIILNTNIHPVISAILLPFPYVTMDLLYTQNYECMKVLLVENAIA